MAVLVDPEKSNFAVVNCVKSLQVLRPRSLAQSTITYRDIPRVTTALGLKLNDAAAERAFFAKDYSKVSYADFRALWARAEQAKQDEQKLIAAHASTHAIICNKLIKVGTEAIVGVIYRDPPFATEHLLKFRHNLPLAGRTCKDVGI